MEVQTIDEQVVARQQIQDLVARYNFAWDDLSADGVVNCFVDDGVFIDAKGFAHHGHDAIKQFVQGSDVLFGRMRHITSTHLVTFEQDDTAIHRCYLVFASFLDQGGILHTGDYRDIVVLEHGKWLFRERIVRLN
jgi:uncharacterized protein (TIGR02246 family)